MSIRASFLATLLALSNTSAQQPQRPARYFAGDTLLEAKRFTLFTNMRGGGSPGAPGRASWCTLIGPKGYRAVVSLAFRAGFRDTIAVDPEYNELMKKEVVPAITRGGCPVKGGELTEVVVEHYIAGARIGPWGSVVPDSVSVTENPLSRATGKGQKAGKLVFSLLDERTVWWKSARSLADVAATFRPVPLAEPPFELAKFGLMLKGVVDPLSGSGSAFLGEAVRPDGTAALAGVQPGDLMLTPIIPTITRAPSPDLLQIELLIPFRDGDYSWWRLDTRPVRVGVGSSAGWLDASAARVAPRGTEMRFKAANDGFGDGMRGRIIVGGATMPVAWVERPALAQVVAEVDRARDRYLETRRRLSELPCSVDQDRHAADIAKAELSHLVFEGYNKARGYLAEEVATARETKCNGEPFWGSSYGDARGALRNIYYGWWEPGIGPSLQPVERYLFALANVGFHGAFGAACAAQSNEDLSWYVFSLEWRNRFGAAGRSMADSILVRTRFAASVAASNQRLLNPIPFSMMLLSGRTAPSIELLVIGFRRGAERLIAAKGCASAEVQQFERRLADLNRDL